MTTAIDLSRFVRPGDTVLVGQGAGEPRSLVEALIEQRHAIGPVSVFIGGSYTGLLQAEHADALRLRAIGGIGTTSALTRAGVVDVIPIHLSSIPELISSGRLNVDVVFVQLSEAGAGGQHSLGLIADYLQAAIATARVTIAEVNPRVPYTHGDTAVDAAKLAAVVRDDRALIELPPRTVRDEDRAIARFVAALVPDGATIQVGVGATPDAVLAELRGHHDLGVHTGLLTEGVVDLVECGAVTNSRKEIDASSIVAGHLLGSDRLYRWAHANPALQMRPVTYTHNAAVLASFQTFFAVNSAIEVDLTGQINTEMVDGRHVGTIGGQGSFARAAIMSANGRSIVALPSTVRGGAVSKIVTRLADGVVSTARSDADVIVTEHGVADLRGQGTRERAKRLIAIAHPDHRERLERAES